MEGDAVCDASFRSEAAIFTAVVIQEHNVADDELQLNLRVGDIVHVVEVEDDWAGGYKVGQNEITGWFPRMCIKREDAPETPADSRLKKRKDGLPVTEAQSPIRQILSVPTPQSAARMREESSEMNKLKEQVQQLQQEVSKKDTSISELREQLSTWEQEALDLRSRLAASEVQAQRERGTFEKDVANLRLERDEARRQVESMQAECNARLAKNREACAETQRADSSQRQSQDISDRSAQQRCRQAKPEELNQSKLGANKQCTGRSRSMAPECPPPRTIATEVRQEVTSKFEEDTPNRGSVQAQIRALEKRSSSATRRPFPRHTTANLSNSCCSVSVRGMNADGERPARATMPNIDPTLASDEVDTTIELGLSPMAKKTSACNAFIN